MGLKSCVMSIEATHDQVLTPSAPARAVIHPVWVRVTHWINVVAMIVMIGSGWEIYNASPLFPFVFPRTRAALLTGRNHHSVGMGGITEIATSAPGYTSIRPKTRRAAGRDAQAQRLLHRPVRQVPRGAGLGDQPDGAVRPLAHRRRRLRVLLRLHRRRDQPVVPGDLRGHHAGRAARRRPRRATTSPRT